MNRTVHVLPSDRGWAVTVEDTDGATSHYPSQEKRSRPDVKRPARTRSNW